MLIANGEGADKNDERYSQPEYRIAFTIYDNNTGETVCKSSTYLGKESGETELWSLLRYFKREARRAFEAVHYPKEDNSGECL